MSVDTLNPLILADPVELVAPPAQRGGATRVLRAPRERLTARQQEVVGWLPRDRRDRPVLRGPGRNPKAMACFVDVGDGELLPASFDFKVSEAAVDEDVPAILDAWATQLEAARRKVLDRRRARAEREAARAAKAASAEPNPATEASSATSSPACTGQLEILPVQDVNAVPDPRAGRGSYQRRATWEDADDELHDVFARLPLLADVEVEDAPGAESLRVGGRTWGALVRILRFDAEGVETATVLDALEERFGRDWRREDLVEDLDIRLSQAFEDIRQAQADLRSWVEEAKPRGIPETLPRKGPKPPPLVRGLVPLLDLARQLLVDLCTAMHAARRILDDLQSHASWAAAYAQAVLSLEHRIVDALGCTRIPDRILLLRDWSDAIGAIDATAQLSLWSQAGHRRLQRAVEPQVHRARMWRRVWRAVPQEAAAAVAVMCLLG